MSRSEPLRGVREVLGGLETEEGIFNIFNTILPSFQGTKPSTQQSSVITVYPRAIYRSYVESHFQKKIYKEYILERFAFTHLFVGMHVWGGQTTTWESRVSPATMWIPGIELRLLAWAASAFLHPLSHLTSRILGLLLFYKCNFLSLKLGNKSWRNGGGVRLGVQHVRGSGFNKPSDKEWIARWRPSLLLPLYFLQNLKSLYKHSEALRMSKWPVEHCKWKTENICKTIGISFLEKAVSYRNRSAIFFAFILFYFKNKPNRGTIEEKTARQGVHSPLSSAYVMYACGGTSCGINGQLIVMTVPRFAHWKNWKAGFNIRCFIKWGKWGGSPLFDVLLCLKQLASF